MGSILILTEVTLCASRRYDLQVVNRNGFYFMQEERSVKEKYFHT
jgi:hypothetical protein